MISKLKSIFSFSRSAGDSLGKQIAGDTSNLLKLALIISGLVAIIFIVVWVAPLIVIYAIYDRRKTHQERMKGVGKKKENKNLLTSVNNWANENSTK